MVEIRLFSSFFKQQVIMGKCLLNRNDLIYFPTCRLNQFLIKLTMHLKEVQVII